MKTPPKRTIIRGAIDKKLLAFAQLLWYIVLVEAFIHIWRKIFVILSRQAKNHHPSLSLIVLLVCVFTQSPLLARYWRVSDYKTTTLANYKRHPALKRAINFQNIDYAALNAAIFYETNARRKQHGLPTLSYHPLLEKTAFYYSKTMVKQNFFSHVNPNNGSDPQKRAKKAGIANPFLAENIATHFGIHYEAGKSVYTPAKGQFSYTPQGPLLKPHTYLSFAKAVLYQWMHSPAHRKNILSKHALELGCGAYLFFKKSFNDMPMFKATQNFQFYKRIIPKKQNQSSKRLFNRQLSNTNLLVLIL